MSAALVYAKDDDPVALRGPAALLGEESGDELRAFGSAAALDRAGGSPARAARLLGISRACVYNKLKEHRIQP